MAVRDIRYLLQKRAEQTLTGTYYERKPTNPTESGATFHYEYVDPTSWTFRRLFGNVTGNDFSQAAIKTVTALDFRVPSFVVTQDGKFYSVVQVERDQTSAGKQAQRLWVSPVGVTYVLRMVEVENPWEVRS